ETTLEVLSTVIEGCGIATVKLPTPRSDTVFSVPSLPVTRTVQPPSAGEAGKVNWYWKIQLAAVSDPQVAGAPCASIGWAFTCVLPAESMTLMIALPISNAPNGSLTCARTNTVAFG